MQGYVIDKCDKKYGLIWRIRKAYSMNTVQNLVTTRAPFIRTPLFLGDFEIVGDKSWGSNQDILFQRKNPHFFRIPQNFGNRIVALFLSHDFRHMSDFIGSDSMKILCKTLHL